MESINLELINKIARNAPGEHSVLMPVADVIGEEGYSVHRALAPHPVGMPISAFRNENGELMIVQKDGLCHALVAGNTGSGKSLRYLITTLFNLTGEHSVIITDVKGELYRLTGEYLKGLYGEENVRVMDFIHPARSQVFFNPFYSLALQYRDAELSEDRDRIREDILSETRKVLDQYFRIESERDPTWEQGAISFIFGMIVGLFEDLTLTKKEELATGRKRVLPEQVNFASLARIFHSFSYDSGGFGDRGFFSSRSPSSHTGMYVRGIIRNAPNTRACYMQIVEKYINEYTYPDVRNLTLTDNLDMTTFAKTPRILFLSYDLSDKRMRGLVNKYIIRTLNVLKDEAKELGEPLRVPVVFYCDEFPTLTADEIYPTIFSIGRGLNLFITAIVQDYSQLETTYSSGIAQQFRNNSNLSFFLGTNDLGTACAVKAQIGKHVIEDPASYLMDTIKFTEVYLVSEDELMHRLQPGDVYITINNHMPVKGTFELYYHSSEYLAYPHAEPITEPELDFDDPKYNYQVSAEAKNDRDDDYSF